MKYISWYHGYPLKLGNRVTGWRSCYNWKPFGLRWISAILVWAYHNMMCYRNLKDAAYADKIVCISKARKRQLIEQVTAIKKRGFIGMLIYNL